MLLLILRGTPTFYCGDEIGTQQIAIAPDRVRDPFEKNVPGIGDRKGEAIVETLDLRGNESATVDRASNRLP